MRFRKGYTAVVSQHDLPDSNATALAGEFATIESSLEFFHLLREAITETAADVQRDVAYAEAGPDRRRLEALQLVDYKLQQLEVYTSKSERLLRDLSRLRTLILGDARAAIAD